MHFTHALISDYADIHVSRHRLATAVCPRSIGRTIALSMWLAFPSVRHHGHSDHITGDISLVSRFATAAAPLARLVSRQDRVVQINEVNLARRPSKRTNNVADAAGRV